MRLHAMLGRHHKHERGREIMADEYPGLARYCDYEYATVPPRSCSNQAAYTVEDKRVCGKHVAQMIEIMAPIILHGDDKSPWVQVRPDSILVEARAAAVGQSSE